MPRKSNKRQMKSPYARSEQMVITETNDNSTPVDMASILPKLEDMMSSLKSINERIVCLESKNQKNPNSERRNDNYNGSRTRTLGEESEGTALSNFEETGVNHSTSLIQRQGLHTQIMDATSCQMTNSNFNSSSISISSKIPLKLKQRIWAGEFVEMSELLDKSIKNKDEKFHLEFSPNNPNQSLFFVPKYKNHNLSILMWARAFNRYIVIAGLNQPNNVPLMQQHMEIVFSLFEEGANWSYYDSEFRKLIGKEVEWGSMHYELYLRSSIKSLHQNECIDNRNTHARAEGNKKSFQLPQGSCYQYHTTGVCSKMSQGQVCPFQHKCYGCLQSHPIFKCNSPCQNAFILPKYQKQTFHNNNSSFHN